MFSIFKDRQFFTLLFTLALPIAAQNLIQFTVSAVDAIMIGSLGEIPLSAVATANNLTFLYMVTAFGLASGCGVLAAQHFGAGNIQKVREIFAFMLKIMLGLTLVFAGLAFFAPGQVIAFVIRDPEVIAVGASYLRILGLGYLFFGFTTAIIGMLRASKIVKVAVVVSLISLVVNVGLNYVLIFGNFGAPALGVQGAAIATVSARILECIILLIYVFRVEKTLAFRPRDLALRSKGIFKSFRRYSAPVFFNELLWAIGNFAIGVIIGRMGRELVAANSIAHLLAQFVTVMIFGTTAAAATMIGNTVGEGDKEKALRWAKGMLVFSFFLGVFALILVQILRLPLISLYDISDTARMYARQITHVVSVHMVLHSVTLVAILGTLRGGGDTRFALIVDALFIWFFAIPLGAFLGLYLALPVWVVYIALRSEDIFKLILVVRRITKGKWIKSVNGN